MKISEKARTLLAEEYERHGKYLTYAQQAMTSDAEFTMCSLRAIERALADAPQPSSVGDADVKRYVRGPEKMEAYSQGDWVSYSDYAARDQQIAELQARVTALEEVLADAGIELATWSDEIGCHSLVRRIKAALAQQVTNHGG